ncbi:hypothetical protein [Lactobacillus helveticus]|uniref:hypothetical protein n=1 Tax=Lactobacillus helveticus TaxID=1587 RepID=UPI001562151E|nr:hypothetical protein [Lactobacillus helveticus]
MQLTVRYQKIFQSILTILSLVSSGLLFAILRQEIIMNRSDPNENYLSLFSAHCVRLRFYH